MKPELSITVTPDVVILDHHLALLLIQHAIALNPDKPSATTVACLRHAYNRIIAAHLAANILTN